MDEQRQLGLAQALAAVLQEDEEEGGEESFPLLVADLLDGMARLGLYLTEMQDENWASLAYFAHLQSPEMQSIADQVAQVARESRGRPELN